MGVENGKVLSYAVRNKRCATCHNAELDGKTPGPQDCRQNWSGAAKAMEPDIAVELAKSARDLSISYSVLVGDDDCTTIKRVLSEEHPPSEAKKIVLEGFSFSVTAEY